MLQILVVFFIIFFCLLVWIVSAQFVLVYFFDNLKTLVQGIWGFSPKKRSCQRERMRKNDSWEKIRVTTFHNNQKKERFWFRFCCIVLLVFFLAFVLCWGSDKTPWQDRLNDALCATKAALEEGIVPGGGGGRFSDGCRSRTRYKWWSYIRAPIAMAENKWVSLGVLSKTPK